MGIPACTDVSAGREPTNKSFIPILKFEAGGRIELPYVGFADRRLTTWLSGH